MHKWLMIFRVFPNTESGKYISMSYKQLTIFCNFKAHYATDNYEPFFLYSFIANRDVLNDQFV